MALTGGADSLHNGANPFRVLQQRGAAVVAIHCPGRTAEVEVHGAGASSDRDKGRLRQHVGVAAEQLHLHRQSGRGATAINQLRHMTTKDFRPGNRITDAQKLGDAVAEAAEFGQQGAHCDIGHAFHGGEHDGGNARLDPRLFWRLAHEPSMAERGNRPWDCMIR
jgi:hypothetical protein